MTEEQHISVKFKTTDIWKWCIVTLHAFRILSLSKIKERQYNIIFLKTFFVS